MSNKNVDEMIKEVLTFKTPEEKFEFQCDMIQISIVSQIHRAMEELGKTKKDIAKAFANIYENMYGEERINDYITDLFTADERMELEDIELFQEALGIRFTFGYEVREEK